MRPSLKAALLAAFLTTSSQTSAQETSALNFTLTACTQDQRELNLPVQSQLEITPNVHTVKNLLLDQTRIYAQQLNTEFNRAVSAINEQTSQAGTKKIFDQFYAHSFEPLSKQHVKNVEDTLPEGFAIAEKRIITKAIRTSGVCAENEPAPQPNS